MPHSTEGLAFLTRLNALPDGPNVSLDNVLHPSLDDERELRKLFAQDKTNSRLANPHVGLVDVFGPDTDALRKTRARVVDYENEESLSAQYVMPLKENQRRKEGEASMVADMDEFKKNWAIFTEGSLSQLFDWSNVVAAGGSVLSALSPLTEENKKSKRAVRKYYHSAAFPSSDVDLFLWGLTPEQAEKKIITIYEAVRDSVPWDVTCIRTKHTISIHSQYPYRSVQIVLRLYQSPAEVLAGFDIDAPCCAYDGEHVWANPRALTAMIRQCNTADMTRRSPSYEVRLTKYAKRGFEVYVPNLKRQDIDPTIYERSIIKIEGLARLLVLEKLRDAESRYNFLESRRDLRGRPFALRRPSSKKKRKYRNDLKTEIGGLEMNDYDVVSLHIPYGPGWDAKRIEKLVYQTDLGMNSTFNPKNKGRRLHRHPAFFGTIEECMEDCCEHCPEPIDEDERNLQKEEDEQYIRGRITFIQENPGRQSLSGSFNPIDEGEWSEQVYIKPIQKLFNAITAQDLPLVQSLLSENKTSETPIIDLQHRDHVGRTALHLAILVRDEEIAKLLIDEGCRMISRVVDGRTALHMAAQYGLDSLIEKMFEKSPDAKSPEDENEDEPDVLNVNAGDWDQGLTPLCYAVLYSTRSTVSLLLKNEADPNIAAVPSGNTWDNTQENIAVSIAECLIKHGASVSTADDNLMTILHYAVFAQRVKLLDTLLKKDPGAKKALDFPTVNYGNSTFPVTSAIAKGAYAPLLMLLAYGAKVNPSGADVSRARAISNNPSETRIWGWQGIQDYSQSIHGHVEAAIAAGDYIVDVLLELGANPNIGTFGGRSRYARAEDKQSVLDWVVNVLEVDLPKHLKDLKKRLDEVDKKLTDQTYTPPTEKIKSWKEYLNDFYARYSVALNESSTENNGRHKKDLLKQIAQTEKAKDYLTHVRQTLESIGAKTWDEIYRTSDQDQGNNRKLLLSSTTDVNSSGPDKPKSRYILLSQNWRREWVPYEQSERYDELFEAAFKGDDAKIEKLCITVQAVVRARGRQDPDLDTGLTPLHAAIVGKRWNTAKLIMGIAAAQYHKDDDADEDEVQAALFDLVDEEDEDDDRSDYGSDYSDETVEPRKRQTKFINVAKKISLRTQIHPARLLSSNSPWVLEDRIGNMILILKSIRENNLEAFVHLLNLQETTETNKSYDPDRQVLNAILETDNPKFLDELIRRTGVGIDINTIRQSPTGTGGGDHPITLNDTNRLYLGLNIHGRKRADLARKGDPNATHTDAKHVPLLWSAIIDGAKSIVEYLASEKPAVAYKYHATNGKGERAEWLRRVGGGGKGGLECTLSEWLGWCANPVGENPLVMVVHGDRPELLPVLFTKNAKLMGSVLHTKIKFSGLNLLLLAANKSCKKEMFEVLLKKGVSPLEVDLQDHRNIYHWLCSNNAREVIEYLLEYLPREVNEELLAQKTKTKLSTPLHIAVKNGYIRLVETLLKFSQQCLLAYDARGFTPLHYAIKHAYVGTTETLLKVMPHEGLYLENGVGKTPYEDAEKRAMKPITDGIYTNQPLTLARNSFRFRDDVEQIEKELECVMNTLKMLLKNGIVEKGTTLSNTFEKFVSASEGRLVKMKAQAAIVKAEEEAEKEREGGGESQGGPE
ncbi:hypothetical protein AN958_07486 [Leucoagaricus sp. SymC.cos]|nr:hypothetical protein AN958_07486 [Leucoagaricus sp. SymC.cos]